MDIQTRGSTAAMQLVDGAKQASQAVRSVCRKSNLFRWMDYQISLQHGEGRRSYYLVDRDIRGLNPFDVFDQDIHRSPEARKMALSRCSALSGQHIIHFLDTLEVSPTQNPVSLNYLKKISESFVGQRSSSRDAQAYIRRAALKLHSDRCSDLKGWSIPGTVYFKSLGPDYYYEHARHGAQTLYEIHQSLNRIYQNDFYAQKIFGDTSSSGESLTPKMIAADYSVLSASVLFAPQVLPAYLVGAALIAIAWALEKVQARKAQSKVTCRDLVIYKPVQHIRGA